jgi:hypothetical protein
MSQGSGQRAGTSLRCLPFAFSILFILTNATIGAKQLAGVTGRFIDNINTLLMDNSTSLPNSKILK